MGQALYRQTIAMGWVAVTARLLGPATTRWMVSFLLHKIERLFEVLLYSSVFPFLAECTADGHFVFSIPASLTEPPLSPALLVAGGNSSCTPQRVVADFALFKIPLDGCGTRKYVCTIVFHYTLHYVGTKPVFGSFSVFGFRDSLNI